jgi:hypothetical protein
LSKGFTLLELVRVLSLLEAGTGVGTTMDAAWLWPSRMEAAKRKDRRILIPQSVPDRSLDRWLALARCSQIHGQ